VTTGDSKRSKSLFALMRAICEYSQKERLTRPTGHRSATRRMLILR